MQMSRQSDDFSENTTVHILDTSSFKELQIGTKVFLLIPNIRFRESRKTLPGDVLCSVVPSL